MNFLEVYSENWMNAPFIAAYNAFARHLLVAIH